MNRLLAQFVFLCFCITFFVFLIFFPALSGGFVLDDGFNILDNRVLYLEELSSDSIINAAFSFHDGNGARPLPMLSFALDYWRAGSMDATSFKTTNLIIHLLTTVFLAFFFRRLLLLADCAPEKAMWGALILALAWAVHPLQVSSVMYVVQRMQTMATMFLVLALWAYLGMRQAQIRGVGRGRVQGILVLVFWVLAFACKEDAPLFYAYVLMLELTVLRFRAVQPDIERGLKQSYLLLTVLCILGYLFYIVPHYWSWESYWGRDFSTLERLMTQARVLVMYIGQIVFPWPDNMTFIYDQLPVSRSLWSPWTTLPSILLIAALLTWAWIWRSRRPLFSFGVLLFFSGHFITSNVIPLELVFEHRNHFPLIGAVLAIGDLCVLIGQRWMARTPALAGCFCTIVLVLSAATVSHAYTWGDPVRHGEKMVDLLPYSTRAWTQLGGAHFDRYSDTREDEHLEKAIKVNEAGLEKVKAPALASNLVIYKSLLGTVTSADWQRFLEVLDEAPKSWQNKFVVWTLMNNVDRGFDVNAHRVIDAIEVLTNKMVLKDTEYLRMAVFTFKNAEDKQKALPLFARFVERAQLGDPAVDRILGELVDAGYMNWVEELKVTIEKKKAHATRTENSDDQY
ncbi:hypothetical protein [Marinobacter sp. MMG032]|uniref:Uncharacterized protein n=1 Tax=Marinobacter sp. MMG032 TaxID=3158548 RepID=A0AAU7MLG0_9GAMM